MITTTRKLLHNRSQNKFSIVHVHCIKLHNDQLLTVVQVMVQEEGCHLALTFLTVVNRLRVIQCYRDDLENKSVCSPQIDRTEPFIG